MVPAHIKYAGEHVDIEAFASNSIQYIILFFLHSTFHSYVRLIFLMRIDICINFNDICQYSILAFPIV